MKSPGSTPSAARQLGPKTRPITRRRPAEKRKAQALRCWSMMDALSIFLQTTAAAASAILMGVCGVCLCVRLTRVMRERKAPRGWRNGSAQPDGRAMALAAAAAVASRLMLYALAYAFTEGAAGRFVRDSFAALWDALGCAALSGHCAGRLYERRRRAASAGVLPLYPR